MHPNLPRDWLPPGKRAAVCFTIDDVHPAKSSDCYEAGGDLGDGALGNLERLLDKHPALKVTLFLTADWREKSPVPTRRLMSRIPWLDPPLPPLPPLSSPVLPSEAATLLV